MNLEKLTVIRTNVLNSAVAIVPNNRDDLVELANHTDALRAAAGHDGPDSLRVSALCMGVRNAPDNIVYHERLHLLQWFGAVDALTPAPSPPAPPAPPSEPPAE